MRGMWNRLIYDVMYRFVKPVWDTGTTPPELIEWVKSQPAPGSALDLGCGTGTHAIYLAQQGWQVIGVDFVPKAIATACEKAKQAHVQIDFRVGDVTRLDDLAGSFDLVLDVGCFHGLDASERMRYAEQLARLAKPGGTFLLWALDRPAPFEDYGVSPEVVEQLLQPHFVKIRSEAGSHNGRPTTWYWFTRR
jgi:SAM-dependent methyltransferase